MISRSKLVLPLFFACSFIFQVHAQTANFFSEPIYTNRITVENGLSQSNVNAIIKDKDGFIWIATDDGLNRYDGYTFKIFKHHPTDSFSIKNSQIKSLFIDSKNRFWIGTVLGGLSLYDKEKESFRQYIYDKDLKTLSNNSITNILEDDNHNLWIGTFYGLNKFNPETGSNQRFFVEDRGDGIVKNVIYTLKKDHENKIWVGTENGFSIIDPKTDRITSFTKDSHGNPFGRVTYLYLDPEGTTWIGTYGQGLFSYNIKEQSFTRFVHDPSSPKSLSANVVRKIIPDEDGYLLIGTDGGGVLLLDTKTNSFERIDSKNDPSLLNAAIYELYKDNDNIIWIGTYGGGVKQINKNRKDFIHYEVFDSVMMKIGKNSVLALVEDHDKNIWIGTDGAGLYKFNPLTKKFKAYQHDPHNKNTISGNVVKSLLIDRAGNLYAGTFATGLNYIDVKTNSIKRFAHDVSDPASLQHNSVWSLFQDSQDRIWLGTFAGLMEFLPDKHEFVIHNTEFREAEKVQIIAFKIMEDRHKNLWFGTRENGLFSLDKTTGKFRFYSKSPEEGGLSSNEIRDIFLDKDSTLWVSTMGGGLDYWNEKNHAFENLKSLLQKDVVSVLEDDQKDFWIGTLHGLLKYNFETNATRVYDVTDGLQGNEFNYDAKLKGSDGQFYFGGLNGLNVFKPDNIHDSKNLPPVIIDNIYLFHRELNIGDKTGILRASPNCQNQFIFRPDQNVITIDYAAADFVFPKKNNYAYKLEGFDKKWNEVGQQRSATYTNLPPGDYIFRVKATNSDGLWNNKAKSVDIKILFPWYKLGWVQAMMVFSLGLVVASIIRIRTRLLFKQKEQLQLLVNERTTEIALQKSEIENKSNLLERAHEEIQATNEELVRVNSNLEKLVDQRTVELRKTLHKLIETDQDLDTFLYRSSHDLRGPITTLMGLAQIAKHENKQYELDNYFEKINTSCVHMLKLLKKLNETNLIFRTKSHLSKIDWDVIVSEVRLEISKLDPNKQVEVMIDNTIKEYMESDTHLLSIIILNLMENGIIFRGVENCYVKLHLSYQSDTLTIQVSDNGIGIRNAIKDNIFDMFYRGSEKSIGNGLGLYLVKKSVEILNGKIEVSSEAHHYTTIVVTLPV